MTRLPWYYDLLGTPYVRGGLRRETGIDCLGLLFIAYERLGLELDLPGFDFSEGWRDRAFAYFTLHAPRLWRPTDPPYEESDILVLEPTGEEPVHVAVFVDPLHILHTTAKCGVHVTPLYRTPRTVREVLRYAVR